MKAGDKVELLSKPTGYTTQHLPLTVGNTYEVIRLEGSNVVTTTDDKDINGSYNRERVRPIHQHRGKS
jgi:hypothetical protein